MKNQFNAIEQYLSDKGFKMELIPNETGEGVVKDLKEGNVDIVVTDKNISEHWDAARVIKNIRDSGFFTDILFYSAGEFDPEQVRNELGKYGFVEIVEGAEIVYILQRMIDKNLARYEDIVLLRGTVISRTIDLELRINEFFAAYFKIPEDRMESFHDFVLENRYNPLSGKATALQEILKKEKIDSQFKGIKARLQDVEHNRNLLAHCKRHPDQKNCLITMGEHKTFGKKEICKLMETTNNLSNQLDRLMEELKLK